MTTLVHLKNFKQAGKKRKNACRVLFLCFATSLINSIIQGHECYILLIIRP